MANSHPAYAAIDGQQIEGYTVRVTEAVADHVSGELVQPSHTTLPFKIEANEHQFEVHATIVDIRLSFAHHIKHNASSPGGGSHLTLRYP